MSIVHPQTGVTIGSVWTTKREDGIREFRCVRFFVSVKESADHIMFEFTESIRIEASPADIWNVLQDVEQWWPPSNPEHIKIEVRSPDKSIDVGTEIGFEERVAGIKGRAEGKIIRLIPETEVTWEGVAEYRYVGLPFQIREGVSWQIDRDGEASELSAQVWAEFPSTIFGRLLEGYAKSVLNVVDRDREHARQELEYLKRAIEGAG